MRITLIPRLLIALAAAAVFYPNLMSEIGGVAIIVICLGANWLASRRESHGGSHPAQG